MNQQKTTPEDKLLRVLQVFGPQPKYLLKKYLKNNLSCITYADKILNNMCKRQKLIENNGLYHFMRGIEGKMENAFMFAAFMEIVKTDNLKIAKSVYPFDLIFEDEDTLYQMINYGDRGIFKLNFRKNMQQEEAVCPVVPVILLHNGIKRDLDKNLLPEYGILALYTLGPEDVYVNLEPFGIEEEQENDG